jgi:methylated-DNA-[protein]-cysteine S-methyltransferase
MQLWIDEVESPIGLLSIVVEAETGALCRLEFDGLTREAEQALVARYGDVEWVRVENPHGITSHIHAYFERDVTALDALPVSTAGTPFQERVWRALREIPAGRTASYGDIAQALGQPGAARAVGLANGQNPVALVVPCHRIIGADGTLTGYGGGLDRKRWLLDHEARHAPYATVAPELPFARRT